MPPSSSVLHLKRLASSKAHLNSFEGTLWDSATSQVQSSRSPTLPLKPNWNAIQIWSLVYHARLTEDEAVHLLLRFAVWIQSLDRLRFRSDWLKGPWKLAELEGPTSYWMVNTGLDAYDFARIISCCDPNISPNLPKQKQDTCVTRISIILRYKTLAGTQQPVETNQDVRCQTAIWKPCFETM